jgi:hypothetical protein
LATRYAKRRSFFAAVTSGSGDVEDVVAPPPQPATKPITIATSAQGRAWPRITLLILANAALMWRLLLSRESRTGLSGRYIVSDHLEQLLEPREVSARAGTAPIHRRVLLW